MKDLADAGFNIMKFNIMKCKLNTVWTLYLCKWYSCINWNILWSVSECMSMRMWSGNIRMEMANLSCRYVWMWDLGNRSCMDILWCIMMESFVRADLGVPGDSTDHRPLLAYRLFHRFACNITPTWLRARLHSSPPWTFWVQADQNILLVSLDMLLYACC